MAGSALITGTCHCGAVSITVPAPPSEITHCNCSLCRRYGVLWAYYQMAEVTIETKGTDTYAWGGRNVDFHRCTKCGCVTHWWPRKAGRDRLGINIRLFDQALIEGAKIHHKDSAGTGLFH
ncbi:GFA family protein [Devosia sediminis]|uniref:GFA family protein n=1 Tax=Devosia sediminis TaxID=2798801 RepID=A0A934J233_9HYPH|nr:GFA family protein [Devosia sediminis]MBJ3786335.1 GFA family protein [Devosia sediminis]